jgi:hypothetical protein
LQDAYDKKNIKLIVVIDQVNSLYKLNTKKQQSKRKEIVETWRCLRDYCDGFFLISSKNNPYEKNFDPVTYVAHDERKIVFSNMDNFISPKPDFHTLLNA